MGWKDDDKNDSKRAVKRIRTVFRQLSNLTDCRFRLLPAKTSTCVPLAAIETRSSLLYFSCHRFENVTRGVSDQKHANWSEALTQSDPVPGVLECTQRKMGQRKMPTPPLMKSALMHGITFATVKFQIEVEKLRKLGTRTSMLRLAQTSLNCDPSDAHNPTCSIECRYSIYTGDNDLIRASYVKSLE